MATTIQIVVAGALLLAWIWALGRPLAGSIVSSDYRQLDNGQAESATNESADRASHGIGDSTVVATFIEWARRPAAAWRRQLMLATMFASFASFLLAIALRGSFVLLFALMMTILFVHIFVAAYIGGRMLSVERAIFVQAAKKKVQRSGGISIRAERAGAQTPPSSSADGESDEQSELVRGSGSAAFDVAAELASQLAETPTPSPPPVEEETVDTVVATADENASAEEADTTAEVDASNEAMEAENPKQEGEGGDGDIDADVEPIFRRAAKDEPTRFRRKAKPIYIESQLDEEDGEIRAKAVNEQ